MSFFFFNDPATTEIYTLSLHDALPIFHDRVAGGRVDEPADGEDLVVGPDRPRRGRDDQADRHRARGQRALDQRRRSEEHTSELQSRQYLVCRLLLEKKKTNDTTASTVP